MAKLRTGGSSIGIHFLPTAEQFHDWLQNLPTVERGRYLLEKHIAGRFLTVGIVQMSRSDLYLPALEVRTPDGFYYDQRSKLGVDSAHCEPEFIVPAPIPLETQRRINDICREAYRLTGCAGMARVDLMLDREGVPWLLEINTIPGLSRKSNLTCEFMHLGFSYEQLLLAVLRTASLRTGPSVAKRAGMPDQHSIACNG